MFWELDHFFKLGEGDLYLEVFPALSYLIAFCISCLVCLIFGRMIASPGLGCSPICVIYYHILYPSVYTASTNTQNMFCVSKLFLKIKSFHSHSKDLNIQLKFQLSLVWCAWTRFDLTKHCKNVAHLAPDYHHNPKTKCYFLVFQLVQLLHYISMRSPKKSK